jgi:hypothetical protein
MIYVFLKHLLNTENGKLHPLLLSKEDLNHTNFFKNRGEARWEFSKQLILDRLKEFNVDDHLAEIKNAEFITRSYYWSQQNKPSNEWLTRETKLRPISNLISDKLNKVEEKLFPIYLKMIESRIYFVEKVI